MKTRIVAEMSLRDLLRRRGVLLLLFVVPLVFYLGRRGDHFGQALRMVVLGVAFTMSTAALFATNAARAMEPRLRLSGFRMRHLYAGRLDALLLLGTALAACYLAVVAIDQDVDRLAAMAAMFALTVAVAVPFGMLLGTVVPRELEGALLLIALIGAQMIIDPESVAARVLPFWSAREIGTYVVDGVDDGYLWRGVAHGVAYATVAFGAAAALAALRLRTGHPTGRR